MSFDEFRQHIVKLFRLATGKVKGRIVFGEEHTIIDSSMKSMTIEEMTEMYYWLIENNSGVVYRSQGETKFNNHLGGI